MAVDKEMAWISHELDHADHQNEPEHSCSMDDDTLSDDPLEKEITTILEEFSPGKSMRRLESCERVMGYEILEVGEDDLNVQELL